MFAFAKPFQRQNLILQIFSKRNCLQVYLRCDFDYNIEATMQIYAKLQIKSVLHVK
jgi:hypothetical protein